MPSLVILLDKSSICTSYAGGKVEYITYYNYYQRIMLMKIDSWHAYNPLHTGFELIIANMYSKIIKHGKIATLKYDRQFIFC